MAKNIVICCDGTGNRPDESDEDGQPTTSNVWKFYDALVSYPDSGWEQVKWYDPGVGTDTSTKSRRLKNLLGIANRVALSQPKSVITILATLERLGELAFGTGITENVLQAYTEVVRNYRTGDRLYLVGFSRGAYTARLVAGVIGRVGLLKADHIRFAPDVVKLYVNRPKNDADIRIDPARLHQNVDIEFIGVWDTVASLGVPLWGWWFRLMRLWSNNAYITTAASNCVKNIFHALSIDEKRSQFFPTLFDTPNSPSQSLTQMWFRGTHAGVGGGYADAGLSSISLHWMAKNAANAGLVFDSSKLDRHKPDPLGQVHDELERRPGWQVFGQWPRWHPCLPDGGSMVAGGQPRGNPFGALHESVFTRAALARTRREARDLATGEELVFLRKGESVRARIYADRVWNRTGVVIEPGKLYKIDCRGCWQDESCDPCDHRGQDVKSGLRRNLDWIRRWPQARWMELVGHVAFPRKWPLREGRALELVKYLIYAEPKELTGSLFRLGESLGTTAATLLTLSKSDDMRAGLLHCFANDHWLTYANNSGSMELTVTCIDDNYEPPPNRGGDVWLGPSSGA